MEKELIAMRENTVITTTRKFGRPGGRELAGRKIIRCPHCREMLMDVDRYTKVEIFGAPERSHRPVRYEKIKSCPQCGKKVGYNLILPTGA